MVCLNGQGFEGNTIGKLATRNSGKEVCRHVTRSLKMGKTMKIFMSQVNIYHRMTSVEKD